MCEITWENFKDYDFVVNCPTEDAALEMCQMMHEQGLTWGSGIVYTDHTNWDWHCALTCYSGRGGFSRKGFYEHIGVPVVSFKVFKSSVEKENVMGNFDWKVFEQGDIAVSFNSKKEEKAFLKKAEKRGLKWCSGDNATKCSYYHKVGDGVATFMGKLACSHHHLDTVPYSEAFPKKSKRPLWHSADDLPNNSCEVVVRAADNAYITNVPYSSVHKKFNTRDAYDDSNTSFPIEGWCYVDELLNIKSLRGDLESPELALPKVIDIMFNNRTTRVTFDDGTTSTVVCDSDDDFHMSTGVALATLKRLYGSTWIDDLFDASRAGVGTLWA